jgi:glycosyltransferase involved in cell wall biosynthesis
MLSNTLKSNPRALLVIDSLEVGGAESFLYNLINEMKESYNFKIITLKNLGEIGEKLKEEGYQVECVNISSISNLFKGLIALKHSIHSFNPDIVHTWMYFSNFFGGIIASMLGIKKIIWSIHAFNLSKGMLKQRTRFLIKVSILLAKIIPSKIIYCSEASLNIHEEIGFPSKKSILINNGINLDPFMHGPRNKNPLIKLKIPVDRITITLVARYDVQKNHLGFIEALGHLKQEYNSFSALFIGKGCDKSNHELVNKIERESVINNVFLLGQRSDISDILANTDIFVMPSLGEAFPISLCEAMASAVPCIATNVGDVEYILGNNKYILDSWDAKNFSKLILEMCIISQESRKKIGLKLQKRVEEKFSIKKIAELYDKQYCS